MNVRSLCLLSVDRWTLKHWICRREIIGIKITLNGTSLLVVVDLTTWSFRCRDERVSWRTTKARVLWVVRPCSTLRSPAMTSPVCGRSRSHLQRQTTLTTFSLSLSLSLSQSLSNGHFPGGHGLAGARVSPFWIPLELRMIEVVVTTGALRRAKLESKCHYQQTNTQFLQAGRPSCRPTNSVRA